MTTCPPCCDYDCCLNRGGGVTYPGQGVVSSTDKMVWLLKKAEPRARREDAQAIRSVRRGTDEKRDRYNARRREQNARAYQKRKLRGAT